MLPTYRLPRILLVTLLGLTPLMGHAEQPTGRAGVESTGAIVGRVLDPAKDSYLERARLTVEGSSAETFTDADGYYRIAAVPAGKVRLRVFYTGMASHEETVSVQAGQTTRLDLALHAAGRRAGSEDDVVKLAQFKVSTSKEIEGAAIAINEQRFAANMKTIVATDEFGYVPEGNIGEFMKFLPGITAETQGGLTRSISVGGVSSDYVPVSVGGFSLASAQLAGGTTRGVGVDMLPINNLARIEVSFSPTPDSPGGALSGSVDLVPRSAFERSRPRLDYTVYLAMRDNARDFSPSPGPTKDAERKVKPGFNFVYVVPVNQSFGFTLSGGYSNTYLDQEQIDAT